VETPQGREQNARFVVLDGLRGMAAFAVVTVHTRSPTWQALLSNAPLAVDFFFALSGFVIAHAYLEDFRRGLSAFEFVRARCVRFWPMLLAAYAMVVIGHVLLSASTGKFLYPLDHYLPSLALGLAFLPVPPSLSPDFRTGFPLVGPSYTLFLELSANLAFALIVARLTRSLHAAIVVALGGLLIWSASAYGTVILGWGWHGFIGALPRVGFSFFAGALVYDFWRKWHPPSLPAWVSFTLLLAVFTTPASGAFYELVAVLAVFPALLLFSAGARATGRFEWACLNVGTYSYGFYILHQPVIRYVETTISRLGVTPEDVDVWLVLLAVVTTAAVTVFLTRFYERPFRAFLGRLVGARATTAHKLPSAV
jgi:peptidoglycan/LPS O-acetylase OafA/YrhL